VDRIRRFIKGVYPCSLMIVLALTACSPSKVTISPDMEIAGTVAIGRTLQSFPRSKPCGRLSPYTAFRLGLCTLPRQISSCLPRGAPAKCHHRRHLLSSLNPFIGISLDFPWRSFTLSPPLQMGLWLLRRLRPLSRVLAFSHPVWLQVKRYESSSVPV
jgi:hypothetical protein